MNKITPQLPSVLDGVDATLSALAHAEELQRRVAAIGFDWPQVDQVLEKIEEELGEIRHELEIGAGHDRLEDETGDLLFVCVNLARHLQVNPDAALHRANAKFARRFRGIEKLLHRDGRTPCESTLEEMDALWDQVKSEEKA